MNRNIHADFIEKRINDIKKSNKWNTKIVDTSHDDIIRDFKANIFTNLIKDTFTTSYMKGKLCADCGKPAKERCHGIGEERPLLLKKALERVYPMSNISKPIELKIIIIAFLEEHINSSFALKCIACHKNENKLINKN